MCRPTAAYTSRSVPNTYTNKTLEAQSKALSSSDSPPPSHSEGGTRQCDHNCHAALYRIIRNDMFKSFRLDFGI